MLEIKDINLKFGDTLGEEDYIEPLTILLDSLKKEANLNLYGRLGVKYQITHQLRMRSSLYAYSKNNISIDPKETLFVTGLPRSGTTFLFHLLGLDENHRSPLFWEIRNPFPEVNKDTFKWKNKLRRTKLEFKVMKKVIPEIDLLHEMGPELPEECLLIHPLSVRSLSYIYMANIPTYGEYLKESDFKSAFLWHKRFINFISRNEEERRWLFKDPNHLRHMKEISECYRSAKFLRVKRDPKESLASICSLTYKVRKSFSNEVSKDQIGNFMLSYWEDALIKYNQFKQENPNRVYEVNFEDLIKDPVSIIESIYKEFNFEWDSNLKHKLVKEVENHTEFSNTKKHIYSLNDFGLDEEEVEKRLSI